MENESAPILWGSVGGGVHLHTDILQQLDEVVDVADIWNVMNGYCLTGQQCGTDNLQGFVLGALRSDFATQQVAALYLE